MIPVCLHGVIFSVDMATKAPFHRQVKLGPLAALVSDMGETSGEGDGLQAILTHDRLLGVYLATGPVLPVRLGTCFSDEARLQAALTPQLSVLELQLHRLAGLAEYALVVEHAPLPAEQALPPPATGRDFLRVRKQTRDRRSLAADARATGLRHLRAHANTLAKASELRAVTAPRLLSLSLLMDPASAKALQASFPDWSASFGMAARLTGPFPPYSFANLPVEDMSNA